MFFYKYVPTKLGKKPNEAEWINYVKKESQSAEENPKEYIHIDSLRETLDKVSNWNTPALDDIHWF